MRLAYPLLVAALAAAALPLAPANAQVAQPAVDIAPGHTLLTVSAEGRTFTGPDLAIFTAGVTTQGPNAAEALAENSRAMTQVIAGLKRGGIAERDIQTSNLSLNPISRDPNQEAMMAARVANQPYVPLPSESQVPRIIGYTASNNVSVRQRNLKDYGKVVDTLVGAGANQVNGPNFQLDDQEAALDAARIEAVATARARAELYARAAGLRVQRIVSISEGGGYYGPPPVMFARAVSSAGVPPPPPSPVQPGELQMTANVTVLFELAP